MPTISIEPADDPAPLDDALRHLAGYDWIAFTSRNAVRAVWERLARLGLEVHFPPELRIAAVGPSTARELAQRGVTSVCMPADATAAALAVTMRRIGVHGAAVLLPLGDRARSDLHQGLEAGGARVHTVIAYRTVPVEKLDAAVLDRLRAGTIDVVALTSPSAVEQLHASLGSGVSLPSRVRLACIGPTTAQTVRTLQLGPAVVAEEHTLDGLEAAIRSLYETKRRNDRG
jgi:uroporphyrinogen III methyltransferase/synthase